jgi:hypothetical protein
MVPGTDTVHVYVLHVYHGTRVLLVYVRKYHGTMVQCTQCTQCTRVQCTYTVYVHVHMYVRTYVPMVRSVLPSGTTGTMVSAALASELVRPRVGLAYVEERSDPSSGPILKASLAWRSRTSCSARCWAFLCAKWLHRHSRLHWVPHPNAIQAQA